MTSKKRLFVSSSVILALLLVISHLINSWEGETPPPPWESSPPRQLADEVLLTPDVAIASYMCKVTAYCPCEKCCGRWADGYFADGTPVEGVGAWEVVAAPSDIPFGTILVIEGIGPVTVRDRGGSIIENTLDLYFTKHEDALRFGRQEKRVWVLESQR